MFRDQPLKSCSPSWAREAQGRAQNRHCSGLSPVNTFISMLHIERRPHDSTARCPLQAVPVTAAHEDMLAAAVRMEKDYICHVDNVKAVLRLDVQ